MATTTITITSSTNPSYGGRIVFDGAIYARTELDGGDVPVSFDGGVNVSRAFAFFDLSTDPTFGGTITKVELLATVASVGGTHEVVLSEGNADDLGISVALDDEFLYAAILGSMNPAATTTPSAGSLVVDLGANAIISAAGAISVASSFCVGVYLSNEAAAGSVVFDAAAGFGLRITYTPVATGFNAIMMTGAGA